VVKTLEYGSTRVWVNKLLNAWPLCLDSDSIRTLLSLAHDEEGLYHPGSQSLFYNGYWFVRLTLPFGVWLHLKPLVNLRLQCGAGWALNGRFKLTLRKQSDESAAAGVSGKNYNQAVAWQRGTA
jgi:hypothetical protein